MCGIFGYVGPRTDAAEIVLEGLKRLEYRGYDSWGVAVVPTSNVIPAKAGIQNGIPDRVGNDKTIVVKKRIGKIGDATVKDLPKSSFAFGHTRWATHGGVTELNAHPHLDCSGTIALIHNGIVENYEELKKSLLKKGHKFLSQTDTEVAVHLIEEYAKKTMFSKAVQKAFIDMDGLNAIIAMSSDAHQFVAARNGSPLVVGFGDGENYLASDASALLPHTKQVHFLEDDELALISARGIMIFNAHTGDRIKPRKQMLTWSVEQAEMGSYPTFMLKEIHEQPAIIAEIAADSAGRAVDIADTIKKAQNTYMIGCGTAAHACLAGTYLFSKVASKEVSWAIGSEFGYELDFLNKDSLVIALSQSGETMDTMESVKKAREKHAKILTLVNVLGSSLYREADYKSLIGAGPEKSVASTKAFTGKLAHLVLWAYALAGDVKAGQRALTDAVKSTKAVLAPKSTSAIHTLAKKLKKTQDMYVIGRGLSYPTALEVALKIKEISYIHAEGLAAGELKHGPLALIQRGTPCIAYVPSDETYGANLAAAMEMKARGAFIIGVAEKKHEVFDAFIKVADAGVATIIPNVVAGQLLAYYLTIEKGIDPDKPRNLAKSVTVK